MVTSEAQEIKKQEVLVRFSIISYKTRLSVIDVVERHGLFQSKVIRINEFQNSIEKAR